MEKKITKFMLIVDWIIDRHELTYSWFSYSATALTIISTTLTYVFIWLPYLYSYFTASGRSNFDCLHC